jgi:hypothetical protein
MQAAIHLNTVLCGLGEDAKEWQMFCPHCGRQFLGNEVNLQDRSATMLCPACQQSFRLTDIRRFMPEPILGLSEAEHYTLPELPELHTEQTEDTLTLTYTSSPTWWKTLGIFSAEIGFTIFGLLLLLSFYLFVGEPANRGLLVGVMGGLLVYAPVLIVEFYSVLLHCDAYRGLYANWSIQIDRYRFVIHRHYAGDNDMVYYDRREIQRICWKAYDQFAPPPSIRNRFPSLLGNDGNGGVDLVLRNGTVAPLPCIVRAVVMKGNAYDPNCQFVNYLNRWLADCPSP